MKKSILLLACVSFVYTSNAQVIIDTVSIGTGYANQKWYSLQNDEQGSAPKNNWDIAFDAGGQGASIHINSVTGTKLWLYPGADTSGWATLDTAGLSTWIARYNSDTSWSVGAFNQPLSSNPYDLGWGIYSTITHYVTGDSLYVIKLASGTYKKIWIKLLANGVYTFRYANLSGTSDTTAQLTKSLYTGKNFAYYSLQNNLALDREPLSANWDLLFTQYTAFIPSPYTVSGILHNAGVTTAHIEPIANPNTYSNWSGQTYNTAINEIGYDWKTFTTSYVIDDSLVYFIKTKTGDVWKVIPTGFGGSSTGNYIFSKEKVSSVGIANVNGNSLGTLVLYPNPASGENTTVIYSFESSVSSAIIKIYDLSGKSVYSENLRANTGLNTYKLNTSMFNAGMYFVTVECDGNKLQQKLIVK
ncbi:MAG: T9SS type A sorting domain-containing protein [Bacteroidetes bacterium]|nr:T9SS type A sorting domain-containing protein [Bacteroidota bacterium]